MSSTYEVWLPDRDQLYYSTDHLSLVERLAAGANDRAPHVLDYRVFEIPHRSGFEPQEARPLREFVPPLQGPKRPTLSDEELAASAEGCLAVSPLIQETPPCVPPEATPMVTPAEGQAPVPIPSRNRKRG